MHNANLCNTVFLKYAGRGLYTMGGARENAVACMRYELCISRKRLLHSVFTRNASAGLFMVQTKHIGLVRRRRRMSAQADK